MVERGEKLKEGRKLKEVIQNSWTFKLTDMTGYIKPLVPEGKWQSETFCLPEKSTEIRINLFKVARPYLLLIRLVELHVVYPNADLIRQHEPFSYG